LDIFNWVKKDSMDIDLNNEYFEKLIDEMLVILKNFNCQYQNSEELKFDVCHLLTENNLSRK